jgi:hypothetical protein
MAKKDKEKTTFISKWAAYAYNVMPFGFCNVLATFQKVVTKTFKEYLNKLRKYSWMILMYLEVKRTT